MNGKGLVGELSDLKGRGSNIRIPHFTIGTKSNSNSKEEVVSLSLIINEGESFLFRRFFPQSSDYFFNKST